MLSQMTNGNLELGTQTAQALQGLEVCAGCGLVRTRTFAICYSIFLRFFFGGNMQQKERNTESLGTVSSSRTKSPSFCGSASLLAVAA
jgi:hypothetical protein